MFSFCGTQMKGNSELPQGAQGIGDVLSHLSEFIISLIVIKENSSLKHENLVLSNELIKLESPL